MKPKRKIRSRKLLKFLIDSGALTKGEEAIKEAKIEYRRQYKKQWRIQKMSLTKVMQFYVSLRECKQIYLFALESGMSPSSFCKSAVISLIEDKKTIPALNQVLQAISLCINNKSVHDLIDAEKLLLQYLGYGNNKDSSKT
jgi:hypothetical protein